VSDTGTFATLFAIAILNLLVPSRLVRQAFAVLFDAPTQSGVLLETPSSCIGIALSFVRPQRRLHRSARSQLHGKPRNL